MASLCILIACSSAGSIAACLPQRLLQWAPRTRRAPSTSQDAACMHLRGALQSRPSALASTCSQGTAPFAMRAPGRKGWRRRRQAPASSCQHALSEQLHRRPMRGCACGTPAPRACSTACHVGAEVRLLSVSAAYAAPCAAQASCPAQAWCVEWLLEHTACQVASRQELRQAVWQPKHSVQLGCRRRSALPVPPAPLPLRMRLQLRGVPQSAAICCAASGGTKPYNTARRH